MEQILLFILAAVASLIFNRKKSENKQEAPRPRQRRTVSQPAQTVHERRSDDRESTTNRERHFPEVDLSKARSLKEAADPSLATAELSMEKNREAIEEQLESLRKEKARHLVRAEGVRQVTSSDGKEQEFELTFARKDVVKGVIMAEVLGPPRSRRPYHRG